VEVLKVKTVLKERRGGKENRRSKVGRKKSRQKEVILGHPKGIW
jgi:hypothetical protein